MFGKIILRILTINLLIMAVVFAATDIVPMENGYYYTDSLYSKIYFSDGVESREVLSGPGFGRFFTLSPDKMMIGFKYRENPGGLEAPALYHIEENRIELLHEPVYTAGQVSFSDNGKISYTIGNELFVMNASELKIYDLEHYSNLVPLSPDGKKVVYNDQNDQLRILELDSGNKTLISISDYGKVFPAWSADSRYISYSVLDGSIEIYDTWNDSKRSLGNAAALKWDNQGNNYSYLKVLPDEDGLDIFTDVVVENAVSGKISEVSTMNVNESAVFFLPDGSVMAVADNKTITVYENSLKKTHTNNIEFPVDPITYSYHAPTEDSYLDVPYVNQVYDTPGQRGYSSCAPTTAAMVLAYYGLLPKWPFLSGFDNWSDYGAYVHERYYYRDTYFNLTYEDCNSSSSYCYTCYGGMGYMWNNGSPNSKMAGYYEKHGVSAHQTWNTNWTTVSNEIDKQQPFSICNFLSSGGHLIVGLGRASNGQRTVIVNDPYGDRNESSWPNYNGAVVRYDWPGYNHGHASLNYANSSYTTMPWCIATDYTAPALIDSIVDDNQFSDGFYLKAKGNTVPMRYYRSTRSGFGGHHWWTYSEESAEDICYATWTPQVEDGYYELYAHIPANATATSALYRIQHAAGEAKVTVDQSVYSDEWIFLGKYMMVNDGSNYVYLGDSTGVSGEKIAFDAMKWLPATQEELDFVSDHQNGYTGYKVNFHVISDFTAGEYTYSWDFGDGETATGDSVWHIYNTVGTYSVTIQAEAGNISVSEVKTDYISIQPNSYTGNELVLIYPDSLSSIDSKTPILTWENTSETYTLNISETPDFDSLITNDMTGNNWYGLSEALTENKTYYWKLISNGGNSSRVWAFHVNTENSLPGSFELISPEEEFVSDTLRPAFSWTNAIDKDPGDEHLLYKVFIGLDEESMACYYQGYETMAQLSVDLVENGNYIWYVQAIDQTQATTRSRTSRTLGINTINEAPPAPVQLAPNHNSYQTTRYPHLEWTAVTDPDPGDEVHYEVYYWCTSNDKVYIINTTETSHEDRRFNDLSEYLWTVSAVDLAGEHSYSDTLTIYFDTELDVVDIPEQFALYDNYPNPFNPVTCISYGLPVSKDVRIRIYDLSGKLVFEPVNGFQQAGTYSINIDASKVPSGVYIYEMTVGDFVKSKKMLLLK